MRCRRFRRLTLPSRLLTANGDVMLDYSWYCPLSSEMINRAAIAQRLCAARSGADKLKIRGIRLIVVMNIRWYFLAACGRYLGGGVDRTVR